MISEQTNRIEFMQPDLRKKRDAEYKDRYYRGEMVNTAKLTDMQVQVIREALATKQFRNKAIAVYFRISPPIISLIKKNKIWKHVTI